MLVLCFPVYFCSSEVEVMQENGSISSVAILYKICRKTIFSILTIFFDQHILTLRTGFHERRQHFIPFPMKKCKLTYFASLKKKSFMKMSHLCPCFIVHDEAWNSQMELLSGTHEIELIPGIHVQKSHLELIAGTHSMGFMY